MNNGAYSVVDIVVYGIGAIAGANDVTDGKPMEPANLDVRYVAGYKMGYVVKGIDNILGE